METKAGDIGFALVYFDLGVQFDTGTGSSSRAEMEAEMSDKNKTKKATTSQRNQLFSLCERCSRSDEHRLIFIVGTETYRFSRGTCSSSASLVRLWHLSWCRNLANLYI